MSRQQVKPPPMALESRSLYSGHFTPTALSSQSSLDGGGPHYPEDLVGNSTMSAMAPSGSSSGLLNEREVVRRAGREAISQFLDGHTCFSVLRASGKVVVFDTRIPIQLAFYALVEHGKFKRVGGCYVAAQRVRLISQFRLRKFLSEIQKLLVFGLFE